MIKPEKEKPGKVNPTILNSGTKRVTRYKTARLITQRKAPKVSKLIGINKRFKIGRIIKLKRAKQKEANKRTEIFSEKSIPPINFEMKKKVKRLTKIVFKKPLILLF